jgi:hypothetical protein
MAGKKSSGVHISWPKPTFSTIVKSNKGFRTNFHMALTYAHYELTSVTLKKEIITYLKSLDPKHELLPRMKDINEDRCISVGKYMYILNHGGEIPEDIFAGIMPMLEKIINEEEAKAAKDTRTALLTQNFTKDEFEVACKVLPATPTIQDRLQDKAREVAGEVEGWIDDFCQDKKSPVKSVEDFVNLFKASELKAPHMRHMNLIFSKRANEVSSALTDKELAECYSNFTKPELKKFELFHLNLLKATVMLQEVAKAGRAPKKRKPISSEKLVAKLKYKKDDSSLGIVSQNPVQIIGAKELWVYNTKTRKLAQYKAIDERGLSVKGAGILNYTTDSIEKTVRKPSETLAEFKKASKVKLRTFLKELTTVDVPVGGKLNENHVILRIDK